MSRLILSLAVVVILTVFVDSRHIHVPHSRDATPDITKMEPETDIDGLSIDDIRSFKPSGYEPMNNILFFNSFQTFPCKDGFKKDVLGICREVWD